MLWCLDVATLTHICDSDALQHLLYSACVLFILLKRSAARRCTSALPWPKRVQLLPHVAQQCSTQFKLHVANHQTPVATPHCAGVAQFKGPFAAALLPRCVPHHAASVS